MNALLNLKNKRLESKYFPNLDSYTWNILCAHSILALIGLPITPIKGYYFSREDPDFSRHIENDLLRTIAFAVLLVVAVVARIARRRLERFKDAVRWILDIAYTAAAAYIIIVFSNTNKVKRHCSSLYPQGWWHFFMCCLVFAPISRWYLRIIAFLAVVIHLPFFQVTTDDLMSDSQLMLLPTVQLAVGLCLAIYLLEYSKKRDFIVKANLQEENDSLKTNLRASFVNFPWWEASQALLVNLEKVQIKTSIQTSTATVIHVNKFDLEESQTLASMFTGLMKSAAKLKSPRNLTIEGRIPPTQGCEQEQLMQIKVLSATYNGKCGFAIIFKNITSDKIVAKFQQRDEYKDRLLASVSHELRTSLNASLHFLQAAMEDPETPKRIAENYLSHCQNSGKFLLYLINDILDSSQINKNKLRLVYETCDVQKTLNECCDIVSLQAQKKGIKLSNNFFMMTSSPDFCTDQNRLKQILLNLLSNSLKFTLEGTIVVSATLSSSPEYGKLLQIEVVDTGIGISDEGLKLVFKPFEKIELGDKILLNSTGAGLGLSISNNLVKMLGPADRPQGLRVESQVQKGTKFSFELVDKDFPKAMESHFDHSEDYNRIMNEGWDLITNLDTLSGFLSKRDYRGGGRTPMISSRQGCVCPRLLFVDDNAFNTSAFENLIHKLGYSCDIAYNGNQAIKKFIDRQKGKCKFSCRQYQIILTDLNMPVMDGFELTKALKKIIQEEKLEEIPIVGCSAVIQEDEVKWEENSVSTRFAKSL